MNALADVIPPPAKKQALEQETVTTDPASSSQDLSVVRKLGVFHILQYLDHLVSFDISSSCISFIYIFVRFISPPEALPYPQSQCFGLHDITKKRITWK